MAKFMAYFTLELSSQTLEAFCMWCITAPVALIGVSVQVSACRVLSALWELPVSCGFAVSSQMLSSISFWDNSQWEVGYVGGTLIVPGLLVCPLQLVRYV